MLIFWIILVMGALGAFAGAYVYKRGVKGVYNRYKLAMVLILLSYAALVFFAAMRSVVSDTWAYAYTFDNMPNHLGQVFNYAATQKKDKVFWVASMIFKCVISENYHVWFLAITLVCCVCIASMFARYSEMPFLSAFMFLLTCNFTWLFNGMRQFLAASILFYAFRFIEERKFVKYLLCCIIAMSMHITAFVGIPAYFIVKGKPGNKKVIVAMGATVIGILGLSSILPALDEMLVDTEYNGVISQFASDDGVNTIRIFISLVPVILFFVLRKQYKEKIPNKIAIALNMSIFTVIVNIIGRFTSGIYIGRMTIYFEMATLLLYPWMFKNFLSNKTRKIVMALYVLFYSAFFYYQMVIAWDGFGYVSDVLNINLR